MLRLIDATGNLVQQFELMAQSQSSTIPLTNLPNGLYVLQIQDQSSNEVWVDKVIVHH